MTLLWLGRFHLLMSTFSIFVGLKNIWLCLLCHAQYFYWTDSLLSNHGLRTGLSQRKYKTLQKIFTKKNPSNVGTSFSSSFSCSSACWNCSVIEVPCFSALRLSSLILAYVLGFVQRIALKRLLCSALCAINHAPSAVIKPWIWIISNTKSSKGIILIMRSYLALTEINILAASHCCCLSLIHKNKQEEHAVVFLFYSFHPKMTTTVFSICATLPITDL